MKNLYSKHIWSVVASLSMTLYLISCGGEPLSYNINTTGQVNSYDTEGKVVELKSGEALYGQDGVYKRGAEISYKDNEDGTITDENTGLMWIQTPSTEGMSWADAKKYCDELEFAGYTDWRMPSLKELYSISDFNTGWPYIDTMYFKLVTTDKSEQYWADNKYVGSTVEGRNNSAFGINFYTGDIKAYPAGFSRPEGMQQGAGRQQMQGGRGPMQQQSGRPERPEQKESTSQLVRNGRPSQQNQRAGRPNQMAQRDPNQRGEKRGQHPQMQGEERPQRDSMRMAQRRQGGNGQRPQMQGGQRPQRGEGMQNMRGQNNNRAMIMRMAQAMKYVRPVRGTQYGENKFVDNGNGTITDNATALMWAKDDNGKSVEWSDALQYAENATLAGYSDWRLPNIKELQSIVDYSRAPSLDEVQAAIDPLFNSTPFVNEAGEDDYGYYWSGTSAAIAEGKPYLYAWYVAFGRATNNNGADQHGAGAVRLDTKSKSGKHSKKGDAVRGENFVRLVRNAK